MTTIWGLIPVLLTLALILAAAIGVFFDARTRLGILPAVAWGLGTLLTAGMAGPVYLLVRPSRATAWGVGEVLGVTLFFVAVIVMVGAFLLRGSSETLPSFPIFAELLVIQNAVFIAGALYVVGIKYHLPLSRMGLTAGPWPRRVAQGALASIAAVLSNTLGQRVTVYVLVAAMGQQAAADLIAREQGRTPLYHLLPQLHRPLDVVATVVLVGVLAPIGEEIFFRGLTFGALRRVMNRHAAAAISALFFSGAHLQPVEFFSFLVMGMILAYLYDYTGSLVPGMIAHGVNNFTAIFLFYLHPSLAVLPRPV